MRSLHFNSARSSNPLPAASPSRFKPTAGSQNASKAPENAEWIEWYSIEPDAWRSLKAVVEQTQIRSDLRSAAIHRTMRAILDLVESPQLDEVALRTAGEQLHQVGGVALMSATIEAAPKCTQRLIDLLWDGIGEWRS